MSHTNGRSLTFAWIDEANCIDEKTIQLIASRLKPKQFNSLGYKLVKHERETYIPPKRKRPQVSVVRYCWRHVAVIDGYEVRSYVYASVDRRWEDPYTLPDSLIINTEGAQQLPQYVVRAAIKHIETCKPLIPKDKRLRTR